MRRGEQAARAAGYVVVPVKGHTLRLRSYVLDVGDEVPDDTVCAFVRTITRSTAVMTSG